MNYFYYLPIFLTKYLGSTKLYINFLFPILGFANLVYSKKLDKRISYFLILICFGLIQSIFLLSFDSFVRIVQLFMMICFSNMIINSISRDQLQYFFKFSLFISFIHIIVSVVFFDISMVAKIPFVDLKIPMIMGIIGEPNYSGLFLLGTTFYFLFEKNYYFALFATILLMTTANRAGIITLLFFFLYKLFTRIVSSKLFDRIILSSILSIIILYPLILSFSFLGLNNQMKTSLHRITNGRYLIHGVYLKVLKKNPLGVGYFNGEKYFKKYHQSPNDSVFDIKDVEIPDRDYQQHSTILQVLTEFGYIGYIIFSVILALLYSKLAKIGSEFTKYFIFLMIPTTQLNVMSEVIIYIFIAISIMELKKEYLVQY